MHLRDYCTKPCVLGTFGLILAGFGTLFAIFWADLFDHQLTNELKLRPNSRTYDIWKNPPLPMAMDIYLFNWTNPEDFKNASTKPILVECGPYVFIEKPDKINIVWHPENSTVSFQKKSLFYFDEKRSKGKLDDVITSINVVPLAAAETARWKDYMEQTKVSIGLTIYQQEISVTKLASEFLFDGYEDDLVNAAKELSFISKDVVIPFDKVGWFYMRNNTGNLTGNFNMHTGEDDVSQLGVLKNWNYKSRTSYFPEHCGMINGSAGEMYPQKLQKDSSISFFSPDLCRSIPLDYEKEATIEQIPGFKFSGGARTVDNGTKYPDNWCFCAGECVPSGVLNISSCRFGTPVFMSFPHFYGADPFYLDQVEGMNPSRDKHEFYMTMEPSLGIPLEVAARFQLNLLVRPSPEISLFKDVPEVFFPILWFEQKVTISPEMAAELRAVFMVPTVGYICIGVIIVIGLVMILWFPLAALLCAKQFSKKEKQMPPPSTASVHPMMGNGVDDAESPLMFKKAKQIELQPMKPFENNLKEKDNERYS